MPGTPHLISFCLPLVASSILIAGCLDKGSEKDEDSTPEDGPVDPGSEQDVTPPDVALDPAGDELPTDTASDGPSHDACEQEPPGVIETYASYCEETSTEHCANAGCGRCQVCLADIVCSPPDDTYPSPCECCGDGTCADLCADDRDCATTESCRYIGWFDYHDDYMGALYVCWPLSNPGGSVCP